MEKRTAITCVVAHIDHGKTTLMDSLVSAQGMISRISAGDLRYLDTREDEQVRGITLKLNAITVEHTNTHVIIDTPGHVDFEHLVQKASVLADNFLVLIDLSEGITPRMYSLVNHLAGKNAVLVLNKIDRIWASSFDEFYARIHEVVGRANALVKDEVFDWGKNNIVLACSTLCSGINKSLLTRFLKAENADKNNMKNAARFVYTLNEKVEGKEVEAIVKKYGLKKKNKKHIFSSLLPLAECVLSSLDSFFTENARERGSAPPCAGTGCAETKVGLRAITSFCLLKNPSLLDAENLLFVTRVCFGRLEVGSKVFCYVKGDRRTCIVEEMYQFGINEFRSVTAVEGPALVCIKGNILKNSVITDVEAGDDEVFGEEKTPFFRSKIVLDDFDQLDELKRAVRVLSFTDSPLKVKLNKHSEFEFLCQGKVQFEKIVNDLIAAGFVFEIHGFDPLFAEVPTSKVVKDFACDGSVLRVEIEPCDTPSNVISIKSNNEDLVSSVLSLLLNNGPVIGEKILFAKIGVVVSGDASTFGFLKKSVSSAFLQTAPTIVPFYYSCRCFVMKEYLGATYLALNKFSFVMVDEDFDTASQFFAVRSLIPQFHYKEFVDEIRLVTKGTVYLEFSEHGFHKGSATSFEKSIDPIRTKKGLFVEHKLVLDPEKQRTLKK